jgi:5-methylcytosine-specific restriction protein A
MPPRIKTRPDGPRVDRRRERRAYEGREDRREAKRFYSSKPWRKLRRVKLAASPLCQVCLERRRYVAAVHVHHVKPRKEAPALALSYDNLQSLCVPCHNAVESECRARADA